MDLERPAGGTAKAVTQVLVVDDDDDDRSAMREVLEDVGFVVLEARDGQKALDLMTSAANPSLVILDLAMPVMTGGELVEVMKRYHRLSQVPVLVVSGNTARCPVHDKIVGVMTKPLELKEFIGAVQACVEPGFVHPGGRPPS
jgi:CheY-like chemotaxis protein